jgi:formamidopyrimidine-DNA glycosylase
VPELPDLTAYLVALERRVVGVRLVRVRLDNPFLLRTVDPPLASVEGRIVLRVGLLGKRIVVGLDGEMHLVLHLMIAGRLHWTPAGARTPKRKALAEFVFDSGTLRLTEAGSKRRAALHLVSGAAGLTALDRGGTDPLRASPEDFARVITSASHTLKRALTDPRLFSGIGNAYSDEILHHARLSPLQLTRNLDGAAIARLRESVQAILSMWIERLCREAGDGFPEGVTAFRAEMAVHGRFGLPCPACQAPIQRIVHAEHETNYCARCQTGGRLLADRALSRLLRDDWPKRLEDLAD